MFPRFAAATAVAAALLMIAALGVAILPVPLGRFAPVLMVWCMVPGVWGLWALLAPPAWVPQRLPLWGAGLGAIAGVMVMLVLRLPERIAGSSIPVGYRIAGAIVITAAYYLLWMLVRAGYARLTPPGIPRKWPLAAR